MLSETTAEPLYEKVKRHLVNYIEEKKPVLLPREQELMKTFGVSRNTLRRGVSDLTEAGILKPIQGRGTLVVKYAGLTPCDIGIIITDTIKLTDPWIARVLESFRGVALKGGYNLNLFMCHDYSLAPSSNSIFSHLSFSQRLGGLLMLSTLNEDEVKCIQKHNIPIITSEFCYVNIPLLSVGFDAKYAIDLILERCLQKNIKRIACVAQRSNTGIPCTGITNIFMEIIENFAKKHQVPQYPIPNDSLIEEQLYNLYETDLEKRPELLVAANLHDRDRVSAFLRNHADWNPILINPYSIGEKVSGSGIIYDSGELGINAFRLFKKVFSGSDMTEKKVLVKPELVLSF